VTTHQQISYAKTVAIMEGSRVSVTVTVSVRVSGTLTLTLTLTNDGQEKQAFQ